MKYILLIYGDERGWAELSKAQMEQIYADHRAYGAAMQTAGVIRGGSEKSSDAKNKVLDKP